MRFGYRLFTTLSALSLVLFAAPSFAAIGAPVLLVSASSLASGAAATTSVDAPIGSLIVAAVSTNANSASITGCTLSSGNTLSLAVSQTTTGAGGLSYIYYVSNSANDLPSGGTITCNTSSSTYNVSLYKISGANGGVDATNTVRSGTNVTTASVSTGSLAQSSEIVVTLLYDWAGTLTEASGFTQISVGPSTGYDAAYQIVNSTASVTYAPSWTTNSNPSAAVATFKATAVGGHTLSLLGAGIAANDNQSSSVKDEPIATWRTEEGEPLRLAAN